MNVIGFDDGPFPREHRGDVLLVGTVCSGTRLDGVVSGKIRRDGVDSTREMVRLVRESQFGQHLQVVLLQGIAVGGFNVVDIHGLSAALKLPVLVVVRRLPDLASVERALFASVPHERPRVPGATKKWALIEKAGALELLGPSRRSERAALGPPNKGPPSKGPPSRGPVSKGPPSTRTTARASSGPTGLRGGVPKVWIQRAGLSLPEARDVVLATTLHGNIPEPLRLAHLIAGGIVDGASRGRA